MYCEDEDGNVVQVGGDTCVEVGGVIYCRPDDGGGGGGTSGQDSEPEDDCVQVGGETFCRNDGGNTQGGGNPTDGGWTRITNPPTISPAPTGTPTVSPAPTITSQPTSTPQPTAALRTFGQEALCQAFRDGAAPTEGPRQDWLVSLSLNLDSDADEGIVFRQMGDIMRDELALSLLGCNSRRRLSSRRFMQEYYTELRNIVFTDPETDPDGTRFSCNFLLARLWTMKELCF